GLTRGDQQRFRPVAVHSVKIGDAWCPQVRNSCEMVHVLDVAETVDHDRAVKNRTTYKFDAGQDLARWFEIQNPDLVALRHQRSHQVSANKATAARYQGARHARLPLHFEDRVTSRPSRAGTLQ